MVAGRCAADWLQWRSFSNGNERCPAGRECAAPGKAAGGGGSGGRPGGRARCIAQAGVLWVLRFLLGS